MKLINNNSEFKFIPDTDMTWRVPLLFKYSDPQKPQFTPVLCAQTDRIYHIPHGDYI